MHYGYSDIFGHGFFMIVAWLLPVLAVAAGWYLVVKFGSLRGENRAQRILKDRYARGEITREDYRRMREELQA